MKILATNKRAYHDYEILDTLETGIVLTGDEVKSIRQGHISLADSFATIHADQVQLLNCYIGPYSHAYVKKDTSRRSRRLLLHRKEINKLVGDISSKGLTAVPLKLYFGNHGYIKVLLGIAKHKKARDKKKELRERDIKREAAREIKIHIK